MAATRKRKHAAPSDENAPARADITTFTTISKFKTEAVGTKKRKTVHAREATPPPQPQKQLAGPHADKKRKRTAEPDDEDTSAAKDSFFKRFAKGEDASTPRNKRFKDMRPPTPAETPSKDTAALFDKLRLGPKAEAIPFPVTTRQLPETPPHTPEPEKSEPSLLPPELQDLVSLHAAFLSALSMYYAHNGTSGPVDLKSLLTMTTKTYKKRAVTLDDMRRLLAVELERPAFQLLDFGRAGVCLTKSQPRGRATTRATSFVDEVDLNANFEDALRAAWSTHVESAASGSGDATAFVNQMPLMDITKDGSVEKSAPIFARGHQRLAELKAGQVAARREPTPTPEVEMPHKSAQATQSRGSNLLDRILAKQAHTASLPAGPTKEQLERKAALHRIEDITRILDLLAAGRARCSFSMQAMVQQLQQSLRNPISREEVERCLGLMAKEITPGFVSLLKNGTVTGVVITRGGRVGLEELRRRVVEAAR